MKRVCDVCLALVAGAALSPLLIAIAIAVRVSSPGPIFYWSDRVGYNNKIFEMPKFRSMRADAPVLPTHILQNRDFQSWLTPIGSFLRKLSIDELPQLWSIFKGDMSFVGPRPALFNQEDLISLRSSLGVHKLMPGLTGWAQINGRDELSIPEKVKLDVEYLRRQSLGFDFWIMALTLIKMFKLNDISH
jgi:O-antigen biosynthesis protein WbqP